MNGRQKTTTLRRGSITIAKSNAYWRAVAERIKGESIYETETNKELPCNIFTPELNSKLMKFARIIRPECTDDYDMWNGVKVGKCNEDWPPLSKVVYYV